MKQNRIDFNNTTSAMIHGAKKLGKAKKPDENLVIHAFPGS